MILLSVSCLLVGQNFFAMVTAKRCVFWSVLPGPFCLQVQTQKSQSTVPSFVCFKNVLKKGVFTLKTRSHFLTSASKFNIDPNGGNFDANQANDHASPNVKTPKGTATNSNTTTLQTTVTPPFGRVSCVLVFWTWGAPVTDGTVQHACLVVSRTLKNS